jgi:light-regulated signal transduction histidine kinase (bacteriophytochrome)
MIEQMGGEVRVSSVLGEGTTFSFDIRTKGKKITTEEDRAVVDE